MKSIIAFVYLCFLKLRYRVRFENTELLGRKNSFLFLPNHPAIVDPQILVAFLMQKVNVAPLVGEAYVKNPILKPIFIWLNAVTVSDLEKGNRDVDVLQNITSASIGALKSGKSIVIYPSGQLQNSGLEKIQNKQGAYQIVKNLPENVTIVGVRIRGLWGSMWSKAESGKSPNFLSTYLKSIWIVIANLIIFVPKREIYFKFEDITAQIQSLDLSERYAFNHFMEEFLNKEGEEQLRYIKHYFYFDDVKNKNSNSSLKT